MTDDIPAEPPLLQRLRAARARFAQEAATLADALTLRGTAADRVCEVTVDPAGRLAAIEFTAAAEGASAPRLTASVLTCYRAALAEARRAAAAALPAAMAEVVERPAGRLADEAVPTVEARAARGPAPVVPLVVPPVVPPVRPERLPRGPARDRLLQERFGDRAAAVREARAELLRVSGTATGDHVTITVGAAGAIEEVQFATRAAAATRDELAAGFLAILAAAREAARAERARVLAEAGLPESSPFAD